MSITQTWRDQDERRYDLQRDVAERVLGILDESLPVFTFEDAPPTTLVATIYFDTPELYYLSRARQESDRISIKVRAREYIPVDDTDERQVLGHSPFCFLERKERVGTTRQKQRTRISKAELAAVIEHAMKLPDDCDQLRREVQERSLEPVLISMYERRVWGLGDELRVTLDERVRYYRPSANPYQSVSALTPNELGHPGAIGPKRILEVKRASGTVLPNWLAELTAELPEAKGFSKFLDGMEKLQRGRRRRASLTRPVYKLP